MSGDAEDVVTPPTTQYERKCENWLKGFLDWTVPRSQAPESVLLWTGLFTMAAAIRDHVFIPKKLLHGNWECYPHLYILFVSPPGVINKTTTIAFSEDLLDQIDGLEQPPENISSASLVEFLSKSKNKSVHIIADEFPMLIQKSGNIMYETLTRLFDRKKKFGEGTISRGINFLTSPCANMIAGANPEWVADAMPETYIASGFGSRVVPIYEQKARKYKMFNDKETHDQQKFDDLGIKLVDDLNWIANNVFGEFDIEEDAMNFMESWYQREPTGPKGSDTKMRGYYVRRPAYVLKLAMLFHLTYSDTLVLSKVDLEFGINSMKAIEPKVQQTFQQSGKNKYVRVMANILKFVEEKQKVPKDELFETFKPDAEPLKLQELVEGLIVTGRIKIHSDNGVISYISSKIMKSVTLVSADEIHDYENEMDEEVA